MGSKDDTDDASGRGWRDRLDWTTLALVLLIVGGAAAATVGTIPVSQNSDGVVLNQPSGPTITLTGNTDLQNTSGRVDAETVQWNTSAGSARFSASGHANATIAAGNLTGTWTSVTQLNVTGAALTIDPDDKTPATISGDADHFAFRDASEIDVDDGTVDFSYGGSSGTSTVTVQGLPADTMVAAIDESSGDVLGANKTNGAGVLTVTVTNSDHDVLLQTSDGYPSLSNPRPEGKQSSFPTELAIDVSDPDFPNENVTVEFYLDGSKVGTTNVSSAGEANVSISKPSRGSHDVRVVATDAYNQSVEKSWTFAVPNTIHIKNETSPEQNITVPVDVTFYTIDGDPIFTNTTSDGSVNMTGLPPRERYIVEFKPQSGDYLDRTAYVGDITEQQTFYLLNSSTATTHDLKFTLTDLTGNYPKETSVVYAQRALNVSNETKWRTVAGSTFGVDGAPMTLEAGVRYRLVVENAEGDVRSTGSFTPDSSTTVPITIPEIVWDSPDGDIYQIDAYQVNESGTEYLKFAYSDPENATDSLTLRIHEAGDPSNEIFSVTESNLGNYTEKVALTNTSVTWVANVTLVRNSETLSHSIPVGEPGDIPLPQIEEKWLTPMIYLVLVGLMSMTPKASARTGAVIVASFGILVWWFGWAPLSGPAVGVAGAIALIGKAGEYAEEM